jgi:RNA polymerase sigma-70 factor (ECF subfamily)
MRRYDDRSNDVTSGHLADREAVGQMAVKIIYTGNQPMDILTDEVLMLSFRDGRDIRDFNELVVRYVKPAFSIARSYVRDKESAEDAVQDAFVRVINKCERFRADQPFAPWFYGILRNICIDMIRRKKIRDLLTLRFTGEIQTLAIEPAEPDAAPFRGLVEKLTVREREAVMLKLAQDLTFEEIAKVAGCSVEAAKKRSQRGIERLRELAHSDRRGQGQTGT